MCLWRHIKSKMRSSNASPSLSFSFALFKTAIFIHNSLVYISCITHGHVIFSPGQDVFVGLRSWTENNLFTQWDSTPIYTFQWDYTNGQPDGIAQHEFCVVLSAAGSHLWHNRDCTDSYPSLCYCELGKWVFARRYLFSLHTTKH